MKEVLLVGLGASPEAPLEWLIWSLAEQRVLAAGQLESAHDLPQLRERALRRPCYLLLPQEQVLALEVRLPNRSAAARQTVPYQLEEQLAEEPEALHFALGRGEDGQYPVMIISRRLMATWQSILKTCGLPVAALCADAQLLPRGEQVQALRWGERLLAGGGALQGLALPAAALTQWQPLLPEAAQASMANALSEDEGLAGLAARARWSQAVNLLQGPFKLRDPLKDWLRGWQKPAVLLLALALLSMLLLVRENHQLAAQKTRLDAQVEKLYRQAFPEARRLVNPRVQMSRRLETLRAAQAGSPLLKTLEELVPTFAETSSVRLQGLDYDADSKRLVLELEAPNYQILQELSRRLGDQGLVAELGRFTRDGETTRGRLTLEEVH